MITPEQNELMMRGGPGTPAGRLLRMYWQPAALVDELQGPRPVKAVRLLGEDLVLFRDAQGGYALIQRHCPHRSADLAYGRLEAGGLRCLFHGWLFDARGQCLEMPAEPAGSTLFREVRARTYRVLERNGILFAYLGEGETPALPEFDCFVAPSSHTFAFKGLIDCNWLQALEVGIDPAHASFLHRFFEDEDPSASYGRQFRAASADSDMPMTRLMREFERPRIDVERTEFGLRLFALRELSQGRMHIRVTNLLFPQAFAIPLSSEMTITQWHVPVDDASCYWYAIFTSFGQPVNKTEMRNQRLELYKLPDYKPRINRSNDYGFNPAEQQSRTYSGMGFDINVHDQWAVESQGRLHDRTREYLASSDKAIVAYRRLLLRAIEQAERGERPLMVLNAAEAQRMSGPAAVDGIGPSEAWQTYWRKNDRRRRQGSAWAADRPAP
jgi:phenylpropionate dioxygenase-like ring-hydroxylating dioxygenase large terminal subunit